MKVDEAKRVVYFLANGKDKDENPYYEHLYRVGLDGSGLQQVTPGDYFHTVSMDDNAAFVVNNYSRVNTIPRTDLMDSNGRKLMTLEESDFSGLLAAGYQFPEPFKVKAADGVTDLCINRSISIQQLCIRSSIMYIRGPRSKLPFIRSAV